MPLKNDRLLKALRREAVDRTPVWMMRQAGRYLPEYRAVRQKAGSFLTMMRTPELATEVTLQPLRRFPLDAAILFSDILTIPDAMGLGLHFVEGEGPRFSKPLRDPRDIAALPVPDPSSDLRYVLDAVRLIRRELADATPLLGFSGSPWTLACYMVEGGGSDAFVRIKALSLDEPAALDALLAKLADAVTRYLAAQAGEGADAVMVFDTWGGVLAPEAYRRFSLAPMARIVEGLRATLPRTPVILFTKNGGQHLEGLAATGADALGIDWTQGLADARRRVGTRVALQGNLDPTTLFARPERIRDEVARVLADFGKGPGHVFNLGHGILPGTPPEHAEAMIRAVQELSAAYHKSA